MRSLKRNLQRVRTARVMRWLLWSAALLPGCAPPVEDTTPGARSALKTAEALSAEAVHGRSFVVGALLASPSDARQVALRAALERHGARSGLIWKFAALPREEKAQAEAARGRAASADALLLCAPAAQEMETAARDLAGSPLPLFVVDNRELSAPDATLSAPPGVIARVGYAAPPVGALAAEKLAAILRGKGGVAALSAAGNGPTRAAWQDFDALLRRSPGIARLPAATAPTLPALLQTQGKRLNALVCADTEILPQLSAACQRANRSDIVVAAFDMRQACVVLRANGTQRRFQYAASPDALAHAAAGAVAAYLRGEKTPARVWVQPALTETQMQSITPDVFRTGRKLRER